MQAPQGFLTLEHLDLHLPRQGGAGDDALSAPVEHTTPAETPPWETDRPPVPPGSGVQVVSFRELIDGAETWLQMAIAAETFARYVRMMDEYRYTIVRIEDGWVYFVPPEYKPRHGANQAADIIA